MSRIAGMLAAASPLDRSNRRFVKSHMRHAIALILLLSSVAASARSATGTVEVEWAGRWYEAVVLATQSDQTLIHYVGYDSSWDEWVGPNRRRVIAQRAHIAAGQWRIGDPVEVEWSGTWWKATVLDVNGADTLIRYDGYGSSWDEWVTPPRIR